ncbi:uncharacterized protein CCOS01_09476 [Colletotrichum costaricense]|uniref:Ankyrin repeat protein n=1 Tax=Colletotrichum costaricense TaxID=1209916 RepID=A0AAI9YVC8_9PEZI|nr:uncharacterized protein CCOS01_09476 [Colletotrichum costaricense]KAK1524389.1 hypothetical protein CCOS01_09476 [Colletotrichum costaricense]
MWNISEFLPRDCLDSGPDGVKQELEIEVPQTFDSIDFAKTWLRSQLRHRKLTKVIRSMKSYGLGSITDILLCMIPALSSRNLLPDQGIPRLMPRVGPGRGWVKTATCHKKLVETIKTKGEKLNEDDKLNVAIAVATVDFLSSAHEPYDEQMTPPSDLCRELEAIGRHLESPKFAGIMAKLDLFTAAKTVTKYFPEFSRKHGGKQSLEKKDSWGRQPLHIASRLGHTKLITQLLHMGSRSNELDEAGRLFVDYLVENATRQRDDSVSQTQQNTDSSVTGSPNVSESMFNPCFNALLKFAMDPSCRYSSGKSFLHIAVEVADDDSIRSPEGKGFNIEAQDKNGCTPLRYAIIGGHSEGRTALHRAIERKDQDVALYLLSAGSPGQVQENAFDYSHESLLVTACKQGFSEIVPDILKQWPKTINAEDSSYQQPPISWACESEHHDIVKQLLQHQGPEVDDVNQAAPGWREYTPIHFAADTSDSQRLRRLKEFTFSQSSQFHGLIGNMLQALLETTLILSFLHELSVQELPASAQKAFDKFAGDRRQETWVKSKTSYHVAILLRDKKLVQILIDHSVDQNGLDEDNWSSMDYLKRFCLEETFRSLYNHSKPGEIDKTPDYRSPATLIWDQYKESLQVTSEPVDGHDKYPTAHGWFKGSWA